MRQLFEFSTISKYKKNSFHGKYMSKYGICIFENVSWFSPLFNNSSKKMKRAIEHSHIWLLHKDLNILFSRIRKTLQLFAKNRVGQVTWSPLISYLMAQSKYLEPPTPNICYNWTYLNGSWDELSKTRLKRIESKIAR